MPRIPIEDLGGDHRGAAAASGQRGPGDGVLTLNSLSDGASFIGAMTGAGLACGAWSEDHFRRYITRRWPSPPCWRAPGGRQTAALRVHGRPTTRRDRPP
jgi:hypothetical protein